MNKLKAFIFNEKTPLLLAVIGQSYSVGLWQWGSSNEVSVYWLLNLAVAWITAWSLDVIIVSIVFHKKTHLLHWFFAAATSITVLIFSIAIAITMFSDWKHSVFAIIVFLYSWFLAVVKSDIALDSRETKGNKEEIINRVFDIFGNDIPEYKIARFVGGKTTKTMGLIKEIKESRKIE